MNWHPLTTTEPIPGDPDVVRNGGNHYREVATAIDGANKALKTITEMEGLQSKAVSALRDRASEVGENIDKAYTRYRDVGEALITYSTAHRTAQDDAETLRTRAVTKQAEIDAAVTEHTTARTAYLNAQAIQKTEGTPVPTTVSNRYTNAQTALTNRRNELEAIRNELPGVIATWRAAADTARGAISTTVTTDGLSDGWWENWGSNWAHAISDIAGKLSAALGIAAIVLAWVPILGTAVAGVLSVAAVATAAVALVADIFLLKNGGGSIADVTLGILSVASAGAVAIVGKYVKAVTASTKSAALARAEKVAPRLGNPANRANPSNLLLMPPAPQLRSTQVLVGRPSTWNTRANIYIRSFKGLDGKAFWLNTTGHHDAARALQMLQNIKAARPNFLKGNNYLSDLGPLNDRAFYSAVSVHAFSTAVSVPATAKDVQTLANLFKTPEQAQDPLLGATSHRPSEADPPTYHAGAVHVGGRDDLQ